MSASTKSNMSTTFKTRKERLRTCSSDSGCDVSLENFDNGESGNLDLDSSIQLWEQRINHLAKQNFNQIAKLSESTKKFSKHEENFDEWQEAMVNLVENFAMQINNEANVMKSLLCSKPDISYRILPLHLGKSFSIEESEDECCSDQSSAESDYFENWRFWSGLGPQWQSEESLELDLPAKSKRRSKVRNYEVTEAFWNICLNNPVSRSYLQEIQNLPPWDAPDIFLDTDEESDQIVEVCDIFESAITMFNEGSEVINEDGQNFPLSFCDQKQQDFPLMRTLTPRVKTQPWHEFFKFGDPWFLIEIESHVPLIKTSKWSNNDLETFVNQLETIDFNDNQDDIEDASVPEENYVVQWSLPNQPSSNWEKYFTLIEQKQDDKSILWPKEKIMSVVLDLKSFDLNRKSYLEEISVEDDPEDIFEKFRDAFEEEQSENESENEAIWREESKFGSNWENIILESCNFEWNNGHRFGTLWTNHILEIEEHSRLQLKKQTKKRQVKINFDPCDIFWNICMHQNKNKLQDELRNLPTWEAPDVFLDVTENDNDDEQQKMHLATIDDICDIYNDFKHFFDLKCVQGQKTIDDIVPIISDEKNMKRSLSKRFRNSVRRKFRMTENKSVQNTEKKSSIIVKYFRRVFKKIK